MCLGIGPCQLVSQTGCTPLSEGRGDGRRRHVQLTWYFPDLRDFEVAPLLGFVPSRTNQDVQSLSDDVNSDPSC